MGQKVYYIILKDDDFLYCDDDGYIMIFDSPEQILEWARGNNINPDDIRYFEDEALND